MPCELSVEWLGTVPYAEALEIQNKCVEARRAGACPDKLLLFEHPAVITLGRSAKEENLRVDRAELVDRGIEVHRVARGGDITYHGPGQLVGYPILDLEARNERDVHAYLRNLEAALSDALAALGVRARTLDGYTGVFVAPHCGGQDATAARPRKIASIGVGVRGWVTYHGFALNVDVDLDAFEAIIPCGLDFVEMTSVARELGAPARPGLAARVRQRVAEAFVARWHPKDL